MRSSYLPSIGIVVLTILSGCMTTKVKQHNIGCPDRSKADVLRSATSLLVQSGFTVTLADTIIGLVQAESAEQHDVWTGTTSKRVWQVSIRSDVEEKPETPGITGMPVGAKPMYIVATARTVNRGQTAFGATSSTSEFYYDDSAHSDWEWYWDVRKGLEAMCGTKAVITTKTMH